MMKVKNTLAAFFMGKLYPIVLAIIVTAGHIFEFEMISATVIVFLLVAQLSVCDSVRPAFITVATFVFQVTLDHSPAFPTFSDYYFTDWRLTHVIILGSLVVASIVFFVIRKKLWRALRTGNSGLILSLFLLAIAFSINGFTSSTWSLAGLAFGVALGAFYLIVFLLFYLGISEEDNETELLDYVTYIALVISLMMMAQMIHLFLTGDVIVDGAIVKMSVLLGWTFCNPLGTMFVTLIPVLFYGVMTKKASLIYFIAATATLGAAISTCSRNALLFGALTYAVCLAIVAFGAPKKWQRKLGKIVICIGVIVGIVAAILLRDKIAVLFASFVNQGSDDNGRFYLWALSWDQFLNNKLFGGGFFAFGNELTGLTIEVMPAMAHNTLLEVLSSTGLVGISAYIFYRVHTIMPLIERPTLGKTMFGIAYLTIVIASMLDVFVFSFYTMFFPLIAMAVVARIYDIQRSK